MKLMIDIPYEAYYTFKCDLGKGNLNALAEIVAKGTPYEERSYEQGVIDGRDTEFDNGFEQGYAKGYENCEHDNERTQVELTNKVWRLYKKYQPHLATRVIEFGDELADLLGKYNEGGAE